MSATMSDRRGGGVPRYLVTEQHNGTTRILSADGDETRAISLDGVERVLAARAWYWHTCLRHRVIALGLGFEVWSGQTIIAQVTSEVAK
jgi:hypothetical protein